MKKIPKKDKQLKPSFTFVLKCLTL